MTFLVFLVLLSEPIRSTPASEVDPEPTDKTSHKENHDRQEPDLELLMFLGAWDDEENNQWLDPEIFSEDSQFNQQLDEHKATKNEQDPDHN